MPLGFDIHVGEFADSERRPVFEIELDRPAAVLYGLIIIRVLLPGGILREQ
jgi:hypothetical protein